MEDQQTGHNLLECHNAETAAQTQTHLEPIEDLLHRQVTFQDPSIPKAPLHVMELEGLQEAHSEQLLHYFLVCRSLPMQIITCNT